MNKGFTQVVVLALILHKGRFLFTLRHDPGSDMNGLWQIPGGGLEFGEHPEEAMHREVREELGITVKITSSAIVDTAVRGRWQGLFLAYICEMTNENQQITLNEEATEYRWFTREELYKADLMPGCIELIEKIVE